MDADQTAGGVLMMWDRRVLEKLEVMVGQFSISVRWQGLGDGFIWACSGVYGQNDNNLRGQLWDKLIWNSTTLGSSMVLRRGFQHCSVP